MMDMMDKISKMLFLLCSCYVIGGCAKHPIHQVHTPVSSPPVITHPHNAAVEIDPQLMQWSLYWRCTVGNGTNTWHSEAATLIASQMKAKQLCELLSNGRGICRYKGCVQVESQ